MRLPSGKIAMKSVPLPGLDVPQPVEPEIDAIPQPVDSLRQQSFFLPKPEDVRISRRTEHRFSLEEEGLNLEWLDSLNVYKGFFVHDPTDKQKLKGFAYIPEVVLGIPDGAARLRFAMHGLLEVANIYCDVQFKEDPPVSLSSPNLFKYPVIYFTSAADTAFEPSARHIERFGEYLRQGGFAIVDNGLPMYDFSPAEASLLNILTKALGGEARFEPVPADHPLFTCYFDCRGPLLPGLKYRATPNRKNQYETPVMDLWAETYEWNPMKMTLERVWRNQRIMPRMKDLGNSLWGGVLHNPDIVAAHQTLRAVPDCLWGVWLEDRMVALYLDRGYGHFWKEGLTGYLNEGMAGYTVLDNKKECRLGINLLVYALTRTESSARQYVDWSAERETYVSKPEGDKPQKKP
jgi:hypothetical protein